MLAFATTFWQLSVIAEKYTLNALFATLLIFILLKWQEAVEGVSKKSHLPSCPSQLLYLFAFTLGLSFTHHFQTIFLIPAGIFLIISTLWKNRNKQITPLKFLYFNVCNLQFAICILYFIVPLFLYLYLPLRAIAHPDINMGDPHTWERFLEHIKATQFGGYFELSIGELFTRLYNYLTQFFTAQFTIYLIWFGIIGAFFTFRYSIQLFIFLFLILIVNILHSLFYNIPNIQDHYLPAFIIFAIWIGYGVQWIIQLVKKYTKYPLPGSISNISPIFKSTLLVRHAPPIHA